MDRFSDDLREVAKVSKSTRGEGLVRKLRFLLALAWAAPASALGLALGVAALASGGGLKRRGRVLEIHGGLASRFLESCMGGHLAMTLGHTIIGRTQAAPDIARPHELVHVRQYERWGPLFIPAYLLCSLWQRLAGRDPYCDNPFEAEAFRHAP